MRQRISKTAGSDTTTYDYDELGNLTGVDLPAKSIDYVVDGLNRRVARKVDGTVTNRYLYGQGLLPFAELNQDGSVKARFVYASKGHVPDYMIKGGITYRFVTDQVGSVRLVVSTADGTVAQAIDYDPFGKVSSDTNPGFQPFGFAGGLYDADTGLVRFGARDYDAETGRWTAKDPILFDGGDANLYAYVGNDPVNFIDPVGLEWWDPVDVVRAGVDGVGSVAEGIGSVLDNALDGARCLLGDLAGAVYNWSGWDEVANALAGFSDVMTFGITWEIRNLMGTNDVIDMSSTYYVAGAATGTLVHYVAFKKGVEIRIGRNFRIAPYGNRTGHKYGRYPHYHRRGPIDPRTGQTKAGQGIGRHRPWERKR